MKLSPCNVVILLIWILLCGTLGFAAFSFWGKTGCFWAATACMALPFLCIPNPPNEDGARQERAIVPAIGVVLLALLTPYVVSSSVTAALICLLPGVFAGRLILSFACPGTRGKA